MLCRSMRAARRADARRCTRLLTMSVLLQLAPRAAGGGGRSSGFFQQMVGGDAADVRTFFSQHFERLPMLKRFSDRCARLLRSAGWLQERRDASMIMRCAWVPCALVTYGGRSTRIPTRSASGSATAWGLLQAPIWLWARCSLTTPCRCPTPSAQNQRPPTRKPYERRSWEQALRAAGGVPKR